METVEESINIDNDRKQARENVYQIILMMTQANRALEKSFEPVNTSDSDYGEKLKNFVHQKEDFKKISDNLSSLYDITEGINDNTNGKIERVKGNLGIQDSTYNGITGGANNIYNKLAFENVYIPLENNNDNQTTLQGHVEKSDENIKEINYEIEKLEKQSDFSENNIEEIIEKENEIINDICETCENLYNEDNNVEVSNNQKKQIEENINETIKINNKIEKISLENEKISFSLKTQIRQIGINLYNLYISIKNRQKATIIRELYKLKVAIK